MGIKNASAFNASAAEVQSPPVTANAPELCTAVSCLMVFAAPLSLAAVAMGSWHQTSTV